MVWVVLALLTVIVIAAVLAMKFMPAATAPSPAPPPPVAVMKIPSMPKAAAPKAESPQPPSGTQAHVETPLNQPQEDSTSAEPNADKSAALSSPADASGAAGTASSQASATDAADVEPPAANTAAPTADAATAENEKSEATPEQKASGNHGEPVQSAAHEVAKVGQPVAASTSDDDLVVTETTASVAAEAPKTPAAQARPEPVGAATAPEHKAMFTAQVGAFYTKKYAHAQLEKLKGLGYPAFISEVMGKKKRPLYLVFFGHFKTLAKADETVAAFKAKEKMPAVVARTASW